MNLNPSESFDKYSLSGPFADVLQRDHEFLQSCIAWAAKRLGLVRGNPPEDSNHRLQALWRVLELENWPQADGDPPPKQGFGLLAEVIADNRPLADDQMDATFHEYLLRTGESPAKYLWKTLDLPAGHLLDLGGGWGVYARAWLARHPTNTAVLVDRQPVVALCSTDPRLILRAGEIQNIALGRGDIALLANVLHNCSSTECQRLIAVAASAADVVIIEEFDAQTALGLWFALNMALYTRQGDVWSHDTIQEWMSEFCPTVKFYSLDSGRIAVVGRKF